MYSFRKEIRAEVDENGCLVCTSHEPSTIGYPRVLREGCKYPIHKYFFIKEYGPIPEGCVVHHCCENKLCINLDHLVLMKRGDHIGYHSVGNKHCEGRTGELHPKHKLAEKDVLEIRENTGLTHQALADKFGVCRQMIGRIKNRVSWGHLNDRERN